MLTAQRWAWVALAACVVAGLLMIAALGQEEAPLAEEAAEAPTFETLGKLGEGIPATYDDIPFRFADAPVRTQLMMVGSIMGLDMPSDELPLAGQVTQAVHLMALTAFSLETPHGTPAGVLHVVYEDGERDTLQLFVGLDVAEWSYAHPGYGRRLRHDHVPPAYVWTHEDPDVGEYPGYTFYSVIETQPKPLDRLELHLNEEVIEATPGGNFALMVNAVTLEMAREEEARVEGQG